MYPVDLHIHTIASTHAYSTLQEYVKQAKIKNIKMFAITDHSYDMTDAPHHWHFLNMIIWPRVIEGIGILRGIEANIKNIKGEIDCTNSILTSLDLIIAGFHEPVFEPKNKDINTEAMIATISSGHVHIISHPGNPKFPIDIKEVAYAAARYHVALEINNSSFTSSRKGSEENCMKVAEAVRDNNGIIALGSDSHISFSIGDFSQCQKILNQTKFPEENILNITPRRILNFLEFRGMSSIPEFIKF